MITVEV